jgi:hypothetical protein
MARLSREGELNKSLRLLLEVAEDVDVVSCVESKNGNTINLNYHKARADDVGGGGGSFCI